jgi:hypothetical protein
MASFGASAVRLGSGEVLYAGGLTSTSSSASATATVQLYNPATGSWTETASLSIGVADAQAVALGNGDALVAGGETGRSGKVVNATELYSASSAKWAGAGGMAAGVANGATSVLPDGEVLVAGGENSPDGAIVAVTQLFDPSSGTWHTAAGLAASSYGATATVLGSGEVLYAGGLTGASGGPTAAAELYDPSNGTWSKTGDMLVGVGFAAAARLGNNVLIAGGQAAKGPTAKAQVFEPSRTTATAAPAITSKASFDVTAGKASSFTVTTTGSPTPKLTESGALPPGILFHDNGNGTATISGTPPANTSGTYKVSITASNGVGSPAVQQMSVVVASPQSAPQITSKSTLEMPAGEHEALTVTTSGSPVPKLSESGVLPPDVGFHDNGNGTATISGTVPANAMGIYRVTVTASNGVGSPAVQQLTLVVSGVAAAPRVTSPSTFNVVAGRFNSFVVTATGSPAPAITELGTLPPGMVFHDNGNGTASISGSPPPNVAGTYRVTIIASNSAGTSAVQQLSLVTTNVLKAPSITSASTFHVVAAQPNSFTISATGSPAPSITESGALPPGLAFHNNGNGTATISGTPPAGVSGTYMVTISASNAAGPTAVQQVDFTFGVVAPARPTKGYWVVTTNGHVYAEGGARAMGNFPVSQATGPAVGIASTPSANGYWVVTSRGAVKAFGDAKFYGDLPGLGLNTKDIVAIAPTANGKGYYLVGADGGFFTFGDAKFHGSLPGIHIHVHDIVGMVATNGGRGYMLVGADGGVFTFGDARFYGSLPGIHIHVHDVRAIVPSSNAAGYFLVGADGGAFTFGDARFHGSLPGEHIRVSDIVGIALTPDNAGYWMAGADGSVYAFGNASGGVMQQVVSSNLPVAAIAST